VTCINSLYLLVCVHKHQTAARATRPLVYLQQVNTTIIDEKSAQRRNFGHPAPPGRGLRWGKIFGYASLQPACSVCVSSEHFFSLQLYCYPACTLIYNGMATRKLMQSHPPNRCCSTVLLLLLLLSCAKSHMLSASRRQPHLLHVSAVDRRQTWSMDKS